jgi:transposase-like protein
MNAHDRIDANDLPSPQTLVEAVKVFSDEDTALRFMVALRWGGLDKVTCPRCKSARVRFISTRRVWECREDHDSKRFSVKTGTVMEESPLKLGVWLIGIWLEANAKNSISSYEVHRTLGITQKTAWFMQQRIRLAMQDGNFFRMGGSGKIVEADETYIGGKARNMHKEKRDRVIGKGTGAVGKAIVAGLLERNTKKTHSTVRTRVIPAARQDTLQPLVREHVERDTQLCTDAHSGYTGLGSDFAHAVVDHAERYVEGNVHTNGLENFWSLFKRCIQGTHVSVEPFHLFRYLDAQTFRFNNRKNDDGARFLKVADQLTGKRLTYKALIGEGASYKVGLDCGEASAAAN